MLIFLLGFAEIFLIQKVLRLVGRYIFSNVRKRSYLSGNNVLLDNNVLLCGNYLPTLLLFYKSKNIKRFFLRETGYFLHETIWFNIKLELAIINVMCVSKKRSNNTFWRGGSGFWGRLSCQSQRLGCHWDIVLSACSQSDPRVILVTSISLMGWVKIWKISHTCVILILAHHHYKSSCQS